MIGNAFHRSKAMFAAIMAVMSNSVMPWERAAAVANVGTYVSRGKGKGRRGEKLHCVAQDKRASNKARNRERNRRAHRRAK
jgi:hypothetical protein